MGVKGGMGGIYPAPHAGIITWVLCDLIAARHFRRLVTLLPGQDWGDPFWMTTCELGSSRFDGIQLL